MTKFLFASVTAFALMTSATFAQSTTSETTNSTTTTVVPAAPVVESYSTSKTQKIIDSNGTEINKNQSYTTGVNGTSASTSTQTVAPDGSKTSTSHEERRIPGDSTTSRTTTTTTTGQ